MQVTEILTDHTLMALDLQGAEDYPIRFYLDIMDQFDRAGIHWHWHPALEFNVITKGTMEYFVENEHYALTAGQGIVKNAHLLHMAQPASHTPDAAMFSVIMDPAFLAPAGSVIYRKYIAPLLGSQGLGSLVLRPEVPWQRAMLEGLRQAYALSQARQGPMNWPSTPTCARFGSPWQSTRRNSPGGPSPPPNGRTRSGPSRC